MIASIAICNNEVGPTVFENWFVSLGNIDLIKRVFMSLTTTTKKEEEFWATGIVREQDFLQ
jgi:hypothetical protein